MSATFVVALSGIFFGGDAISGEFQNKTGYFTLPNPIRRSCVYVGQVAGRVHRARQLSSHLRSDNCGVNGGLLLRSNVPYQFGESFLFAWFYLVAVLGFTFFFSSLFKSGSYSILVTAILFLFAFTLIETLVSCSGAQVEPLVAYYLRFRDNRERPHWAASPATRPWVFLGPAGGGATFTTFNVGIGEGLVDNSGLLRRDRWCSGSVLFGAEGVQLEGEETQGRLELGAH